MDISIHNALITLLVERDDVDATNAIYRLTNAETNVLAEYVGDRSVTPASRHLLLTTPLPEHQIDSLIIGASRNGARDIFTA